jgi:hypothetical protein
VQYSNTLLTLTVGSHLAFASIGTQIARPHVIRSTSDRGALPHDSQAAEWEELDRNAMTSDRIDAVAEYLRSTGQASA